METKEQILSRLASKSMRNALETGAIKSASDIPSLFIKQRQIVDPNSEQGRQFQQYIESVAQKVAPQHTKPTIYLLSNDDVPNAYTYAGHAVQIVVLNKGLFIDHEIPNPEVKIGKRLKEEALIDNEDQLAFIIGHELRHDDFKAKHGRVPNSHEQELDCDREALEGMMQKSPNSNQHVYNVEEGVKLLYLFASKNRDLGTLGVFDVHGIPSMRAEFGKAYTAGYLLDKAPLPDSKPLPTFVKELAANAKVELYGDEFAKRHPDYASQALEEKLQIIKSEVKIAILDNGERERYLGKLISALPIEKTDRTHVQAIEGIINELADNPAAIDIYPILAAKISNYSPRVASAKTPMLGKMRELEKAIGDFVDAKSQTAAQQAAVRMNQFLDKSLTALHAQTFRDMDLPNFEIGNGALKARRAPWMRHVEWAEQALDNHNPEITKALTYLGITPTRLLDAASYDTDLIKGYGDFSHVSVPVMSGDREYDYLSIDEEGQIRKYGTDPEKGALAKAERHHGKLLQQILDSEEQEKKKQAAAVKAAASRPKSGNGNGNGTHTKTSGNYRPTSKSIASATIEEIADNFEGYYRDNRLKLESPWKTGMEDTSRKGIRETWEEHYDKINVLLKKFHEMVETDREKYLPLIKGFFLDGNNGCNIQNLLDDTKYGIPVISLEGRNMKIDFVGMPLVRMTVHPVVGYVLLDPDGIFSTSEKLQFIGNSDKLLPLREFDGLFKPKFSRAMSKKELFAELDRYKEAGENYYPAQVFGGALIGKFLDTKHGKKHVLELLERYPTFFDYTCDNNVAAAAISGSAVQRFVDTALDIENIVSRSDVARSQAEKARTNFSDFMSHDATNSNTFAQNRTAIHTALRDVKDWPDSPERLTDLYNTLERGRLFPDTDMQKKMASKVLASLQNVAQPEKQFALSNKFLTSREIQDPELRNKATEIWAASILAVLGKDPGYENGKAVAYAEASDDEKQGHMTEYHIKLRDMLTGVKNLSLPRQIEMCARVAELLEVQKEISADLGSIQLGLNHESLMRLEGNISISEGLIDIVTHNKNLRRDTIDYLTRPLTRESVTEYAKLLDSYIDREAEFTTQGILKAEQDFISDILGGDGEYDQLLDEVDEIEKPGKKKKKEKEKIEVFSNEYGKLKPKEQRLLLIAHIKELERKPNKQKADYDEIRLANEEMKRVIDELAEINHDIKKTQEYTKSEIEAIKQSLQYKKFSGNPAQELQLTQLYENFWSAPMLGRAAILDQLLTSSNEKVQDFSASGSLLGANFEEALNYTIDKVIPETDASSGIIRTMLRGYVMSVDSTQASLFAASALAAGRKSHESGKSASAAEIAATILMSMGPFERKICQAISNSPELDPEIARPFAEAKGEGFKIPRWQDVKRYYDVTTEEFRQPIKRIGKRLGGASIFTNYEIHEESGERRAFGIKEAHAADRAQRGETTARRFVQNLRKLDANLAEKIPQTLEDILAIAGKSTQEELDPEIGKEQHKILPKLYEGVTVTVNGHPYHFSAAKMLAYGDDFRYTTIVDGEHFQNVADKLGAKPEEKRDLAIAQLTVALRNWLGGVPEEVRGYYDTDDHDAQGRAKRGADNSLNHYGRFDPGGISLQRRTKEESIQLANSLFNVLIEHLGGKPLAKAMHEEINKVRSQDAEHKTPEHLVAAQRTLLALSKFIEAAGNENVIKILASLYHADQIDPVIKETLESRFRDPTAKGLIMQKVFEFMSSGKIDGKVMTALQSFQDKASQPFVTITQDTQTQIDEPKYIKVEEVAPQQKQAQPIPSVNGNGHATGDKIHTLKFKPTDGHVAATGQSGQSEGFGYV